MLYKANFKRLTNRISKFAFFKPPSFFLCFENEYLLEFIRNVKIYLKTSTKKSILRLVVKFFF